MNRKSGGFFLLDGLLASLPLGMGVLVALVGWQQALRLDHWQQKREEAQELSLELLRGEHSAADLDADYRVEVEIQPVSGIPGVQLRQVRLYWKDHLVGCGAGYEKS
ncbi:hypothetical protein [Acidaminococcus sp.]|uniref:hypothetical protein n=1 Tax=Acidaminococcus sp. TaxID=1872103 RepID=UPI003D7D8C43